MNAGERGGQMAAQSGDAATLAPSLQWRPARQLTKPTSITNLFYLLKKKYSCTTLSRLEINIRPHLAANNDVIIGGLVSNHSSRTLVFPSVTRPMNEFYSIKGNIHWTRIFIPARLTWYTVKLSGIKILPLLCNSYCQTSSGVFFLLLALSLMLFVFCLYFRWSCYYGKKRERDLFFFSKEGYWMNKGIC